MSLIRWIQDALSVAASPNGDALRTAGERALAEARSLWLFDVVDPRRLDLSPLAARSKKVIDECIRSSSGLGWSWESPYAGDGAYEWCGAFAARCWSGSISLEARKLYFSSTYRLDRWGKYRPVIGENVRLPIGQGPRRICLEVDERTESIATTPRAGDILLVGDGKPGYGDHVTIVVDYDATTKMFRTLEGNGIGAGPDGLRRQGIVSAHRPLGARDGHRYIARRLIRPGLDDLL